MAAQTRLRASTLERLFRNVLTLLLAIAVCKPAAAEPDNGSKRTVVLLDVSGPSSSTRAATLIETLRIHLTDVAALVIVQKVNELSTTQGRVRTAVALGRGRHASAVIFVEELGDTELRLYWVEPGRGRVWMRQLSTGGEEAAAAAERSALIARGGVEELLEGGRMRMEPLTTASVQLKREARGQPAATREPAKKQPRRFSSGVAYEGTSFAVEAPWQSAVRVSVAVKLTRSSYVAAKYSFTGPISVGVGELHAQLVRRPSELALGYRTLAPLALRAELGGFADYVQRSTTRVDAGQQATRELGRVMLGASAKLGFDFEAADRLRIVGMAGGEWIFNHFDYLKDDVSRQVAIHVRSVRPIVVVGLVAELW